MSISPAQQALPRAVEAEGRSDEPKLRNARKKIRRVFEWLYPRTTFAFMGRVEGDSFEFWEYTRPVTVFHLLLEVHSAGMALPASGASHFSACGGEFPSEGNVVKDASPADVAQHVEELGRIEGLNFALSWHLPGDPGCHFVERGYPFDQAFDRYEERMVDLVQATLGRW